MRRSKNIHGFGLWFTMPEHSEYGAVTTWKQGMVVLLSLYPSIYLISWAFTMLNANNAGVDLDLGNSFQRSRIDTVLRAAINNIQALQVGPRFTALRIGTGD